MEDLSVIFLTSNRVPEKWAAYHRAVLLDAIGDTPLITISKRPMDLGLNLIDDQPSSFSNFYFQMLRGAREAKTPFIAIAEDDTLYTKSHFAFRPPMDRFAYNLNRWSLFTWGEPIYSRKDNKVGAAGIHPRELAIAALEERFAKHPILPPVNCGELGTGGEKELGVSERPSMRFYSEEPILQMNHDFFSTIENTPEAVARRHRKKLGSVKAYRIPIWGEAADLVTRFA